MHDSSVSQTNMKDLHTEKIEIVLRDEDHPKTAEEGRFGYLELGGPAEKALVRKLDVHIIPLVMLLYLCSFLDRVNIGNARLYGMEKDLGLVGNQFQIIVSLVFVTYVIFEVPSNMVLKKFTPRIWIPIITISWGLVATLSGLVQGFGGAIACRLLLGAFESGLFPGMTVYLTMFYTKRELGLRIGYLFVCAALAGACGGLLAYAIGKMEGLAGLSGWRWIFIIEGIPTVIMGILAFFFMANDAETAYFFNEEDRALIQLRRDSEYGQTASAQVFSKADAFKAFKDWKVWGMCSGQFTITIMLYGYSTFLPTIIAGLAKWTPAQVQLLTIPCYALGAICYMAGARISDIYQMRAAVVLPFCLVCMTGYALLMSNLSSSAKYVGCFLVGSGLYVVVGLPLVWLANNSPRYGKRTTASAIQIATGAMAGTASPFVYPKSQSPRYFAGHTVTFCLIGYSFLCWGFFWAYFDWRNARRARGDEDRKVEGMTSEQMAELGDESPRFVYTR